MVAAAAIRQVGAGGLQSAAVTVAPPAPGPVAEAPATAPPRPRSLRRRIGQKLLAIGLGFGFALILAECGLRIAGVGRAVFHRPDGTYGMVLIPGATGTFVNEGRSDVAINADGFRDVRHPRSKPAATLRIAVLGDSFTEALQVPRDQAFWAVLPEQLGGCKALAGRTVETMSFGVSGYSTAQELLLLQRRVWDWSPDVVVLAFLTGNDVADNHPALGAAAAPFFRLDGDTLVLDGSRARSLGTGGRAMLWMIRHSRVLQIANQVRLNLGQCGRIGACGEDLDVGKGEAGLRNQLYAEPADDTWREAWRVTEALLRAMRDDVTAHHARFFLVTLSNAIQAHPDLAARERFRALVKVPDLFYPDRRLGEFAARAGIDALALAPRFAERAAAEHRYLHGFPGPNLGKGHWNAGGHRLAAELIAPWMCERLAATPSTTPPAPATPPALDVTPPAPPP